jgi:alkylated DNA repair dioxygenase AlkB
MITLMSSSSILTLTSGHMKSVQAMDHFAGFECLELGRGCNVWLGSLPVRLWPSQAIFDELWQMHPADFPEIMIHGKKVKIPRWQQAFGRDYHFSGKTSSAESVPGLITPYLKWASDSIDVRLNGVLVNWYDGALGHYIGPHRDSRVDLLEGSPIVTLSLGEERKFRFQRWRGQDKVEVPAPHGGIVIIPYDTNQAWTHAVPKSRRYQGRRISITFRAVFPSLG